MHSLHAEISGVPLRISPCVSKAYCAVCVLVKVY